MDDRFWEIYNKDDAEAKFVSDKDHLSQTEKSYVRFGFERGARFIYSKLQAELKEH